MSYRNTPPAISRAADTNSWYKAIVACDSRDCQVCDPQNLVSARRLGERIMTLVNTDYYRRRERQERQAAKDCDDYVARRIHLEIADRYSRLIEELQAKVDAETEPTERAA
jgi:hypothetical protein